MRTDLERGTTRAGEPQLPCSVLEGPFRLVHPAEGEPDGTALSFGSVAATPHGVRDVPRQMLRPPRVRAASATYFSSVRLITCRGETDLSFNVVERWSMVRGNVGAAEACGGRVSPRKRHLLPASDRRLRRCFTSTNPAPAAAVRRDRGTPSCAARGRAKACRGSSDHDVKFCAARWKRVGVGALEERGRSRNRRPSGSR